MSEFQKRPQRYRKIAASRIDPHPDNFRIHTEQQQTTLSAILGEIGFVGTLIVRPHGKDKQGERFQCLDGHERLSRFKPNDQVPCFVVKLTDEEAAKFLTTYDPITGLAQIDPELLDQLTADIEWEHTELDDLIADTLAAADAAFEEDVSEDQRLPDDDDPEDQDSGKGSNDAPHVTQQAKDQSDQLEDVWQVLIACHNTDDQTQLLEQLQTEGLNARRYNTHQEVN